MPDYPFNHGGGSRSNGGNARFLRAQERGELPLWVWTPRHEWACKILAVDLFGEHATQTATITIPALGFVSGRLTVTFSGGGLAAAVEVTADADVENDADDEDALATTLATAIDTAIAGDLAGVVASATDATNTVAIVAEAGIPKLTVTVDFEPAQVLLVTFRGVDANLIDTTYTTTYTGGGLEAAVDVELVRAGASPATLVDLGDEYELSVEAEIAGDLAGVVSYAAGGGDGTCEVVMEPGIATVAIATQADPVAIAITFGGTPTNGDYVTTFAHSAIPGSTAAVTTTRAGAVPVDDAALAVQHETDIEADLRLTAILASADDDGVDTCVAIAYAGVTGLTATVSAPAPGTLTAAPQDITVTDTTPAGPTVTVAYSLTLALGSLAKIGRFPQHVVRRTVALHVETAFGANRTITVGDAGDPDGLLGATPVTLNTTGRTIDSLAAQYRGRYESALVPTATIVLGSSNTVANGEAYVYLDFVPAPCKERAGT